MFNKANIFLSTSYLQYYTISRNYYNILLLIFMTKKKYDLYYHKYDVIVMGGGGSGLFTASQIANTGVSVACISKLFPLRSNTVSAQGGIAASLSNMHKDDWRWHFQDTIDSAAEIGDEDAIEILCKNARDCIIDLERMGVPFSRNEDGKIAQRAFGGMKRRDIEGEMAKRTCFAADKTGHAILHTLYQQCLKHDVSFFSEYFVLDLLRTGFDDEDIEQSVNTGSRERGVIGCIAWNLNDGSLHVFRSKVLIIATGGYSRVYESYTTSESSTGDGSGMLLRIGLPIKDPEFVQFHPTSLYPSCRLLSEAVRSEGGFLVNKHGERFMNRYDPIYGDLSTRDIVARAIGSEIKKGNGCGINGDHVYLRAKHLGEKIFNEKLPSIRESAICFAGIDIAKKDVPVAPAAHYTMGGIPTNINCEVLDSTGKVINGLMAIGEAACVSIHGANRLGSNSLLDLIVFGGIASKRVLEIFSKNNDSDPKIYQEKNKINNFIDDIYNIDIDSFKKMFEGQINCIITNFDSKRFSGSGSVSVSEVRKRMQKCMQMNLGTFRKKEDIEESIEELKRLFIMFKEIDIVDRGLIWNTNLVELLELNNMLFNAISIAYGALNRKESRGSHYRDDFPERDKIFVKHTLVSLKQEGDLKSISYTDVRSI